MKIAYILPSLRNQGPIVVAKKLTNCLVGMGHIVEVYYFDECPSTMEFKASTIRISMNKPIDFDKYDIIHSHCMRPDIYVAKWKKHIHKAKILSTLHQDTYQSFRYQYNALFAYLFTEYWCHIQSKFDGVCCISKQLENSYEKRIKAPMRTIYNGCSISLDGSVDEKIIEILSEMKSKFKIIGTYAYVTRRKGLNQVIQILPRLKDCIFVVIGEGPDLDNLKQMSQNLGVTDRTLFFPYQDNPSVYLPFFDVYVMPSYSEGFGLAMVEAALAGKAIVCSDIPSFHEIFPNNEACFFTLNDLDSLKNAILMALENKKEKGELARLRADDNFTISKMARNYLSYYETLLFNDEK